jgi:hypothetical protein
VLTIGEIGKKAKTVCDNPMSLADAAANAASDKEYAFLCMDLTFIYVLFSKGYNLPDDKPINVG